MQLKQGSYFALRNDLKTNDAVFYYNRSDAAPDGGSETVGPPRSVLPCSLDSNTMPSEEHRSKFVYMVYLIIGRRQVLWETASQTYPSCQHSDSLSSIDVITDKKSSSRRRCSQPPAVVLIIGTSTSPLSRRWKGRKAVRAFVEGVNQAALK